MSSTATSWHVRRRQGDVRHGVGNHDSCRTLRRGVREDECYLPTATEFNGHVIKKSIREARAGRGWNAASTAQNPPKLRPHGGEFRRKTRMARRMTETS